MASKALIMVLTSAAVVLTGCATSPQETTAEVKPTPATRQTHARETTASKPAPSPAVPASSQTDATPKPAAPPRGAQIMSMVQGDTSWIDYGSSFLVTRRGTTTVPAVPLFRQAIVVAAVRATLAGLPAEPTAEFSSGALTLTFTRGSPEEVASAINRAIAVPEVLQARVVLRG